MVSHTQHKHISQMRSMIYCSVPLSNQRISMNIFENVLLSHVKPSTNDLNELSDQQLSLFVLEHNDMASLIWINVLTIEVTIFVSYVASKDSWVYSKLYGIAIYIYKSAFSCGQKTQMSCKSHICCLWRFLCSCSTVFSHCVCRAQK